MASNLTSGSNQRYETAGLNILKGLKADIVAMQEFNVSNTFGVNTTDALSNMVATTFGTNFVYFRETGYSIPNGIISRYPILASGSWVDSDIGVNDRGFAWAQIDLPGTNDLYVVSVHLKASSGTSEEARRAAEAGEVKALISTNFPTNAWIIVAGDMNLFSETEGAITTFKTFLSDSPVPADQNGDPDTNRGRDERYDRVLPSFSLTNTLTPVVLPSHTFPNGLVFVSTNYVPLSDVAPVQYADSTASNMQHMGVVKDFRIPYYVTNGATPPSITNQPQSLTVTQNNNATFTVLAGGTEPLSYQWRFNNTNLAGATTSSYTRNNAQTNDAGNYSVVITNAAGSLTSSNAALTVLVPPTISAQPLSQSVDQAANATFTVAASGSPALSYQWRFGLANLAGATASSYTRSNAQPADVGNYSVVVSNNAGTDTSSNATLALIVPPPVLTMPTAGLLQWEGLSNLTYTVQSRTNLDQTNWPALGNASSPNNTISFTNLPASEAQHYYRVVYP